MPKPERMGTCAQCEHFEPVTETEGDCRAQPPTLVVRRAQDRDIVETRWPSTLPSDWCGNYTGPNADR